MRRQGGGGESSERQGLRTAKGMPDRGTLPLEAAVLARACAFAALRPVLERRGPITGPRGWGSKRLKGEADLAEGKSAGPLH